MLQWLAMLQKACSFCVIEFGASEIYWVEIRVLVAR